MKDYKARKSTLSEAISIKLVPEKEKQFEK